MTSGGVVYVIGMEAVYLAVLLCETYETQGSVAGTGGHRRTSLPVSPSPLRFFWEGRDA